MAKKNIYTLVRLCSDRYSADTYVSRSFEKLDDEALDVIKGCIKEDTECDYEDDGDCFENHFLKTDEEIKAIDSGEFDDDFCRHGVPIWEDNNLSEDFCSTYLIHVSICEC